MELNDNIIKYIFLIMYSVFKYYNLLESNLSLYTHFISCVHIKHCYKFRSIYKNPSNHLISSIYINNSIIVIYNFIKWATTSYKSQILIKGCYNF